MKVGVVGLGLIGGSIAKAYKNAGHTVLGFDTDKSILGFACLSNVLDGILDEEAMKSCNLIHIATYPKAAIEFLKQNAARFDRDCMVIDDCGTKRDVCKEGFALAEQYGFTFVGGHPMAGTKFSGYKYSRASMFSGASMIIVPPRFDDIELYDHIKHMLAAMDLKRIVFTTAEDHDQMIAFTSQMAHVVSNAFVKSPSAQRHKGYSAGSFRDLTRVAWLNENMWTELFIENKEFLVDEIDILIKNLEQYKTAIENDDADTLREILRQGRIAKEMCEKAEDTL